MICPECCEQDHEHCSYVKCPCQHRKAQRSLEDEVIEYMGPIELVGPEPARAGESIEG